MRSYRIESVGGGAGRGVGRDVGGRSGGASNLTNAIQKRSVRVMPAKPQGNKGMNSNSREIADLTKSGELAKRSAKQVKQSKPAKVVKINSSAKSAPKDKATARGLKAANSVKTPKLSKADTKKFNSQIDKAAAKYKADKKKGK